MLPHIRHTRARGGFPPAPPPAWRPTDTDPAARYYRADAGITSSGLATRHRTGIQGTDTMVGAHYASYHESGGLIATGTTLAADGQGICVLANGRILLAGGAPAGHAYQVVNTIWYSDDKGKTWHILLDDAPASSTRPAPGHTFGFFTMTIAGTEYVYWLGGDPFTPTGNVFRSSDGGSTWTRICTTCPTSGLALFMYGVLGGVIYVMGGQTSPFDTNTVSKGVWKSTDYGVTWTSLPGSPTPASVFGDQLGPLPAKDGFLWIFGSARYHSTINQFSNAVFKFDGTTWTQVLADGHSQFPKSRYHSAVLFNNRLWRLNGTIMKEMTGSPSLTFNAAAHTITRSSGSWLTDGFAAGKAMYVQGSASNNIVGNVIYSLTATVLTMYSDTPLVNEGPVAGCAAQVVIADTAAAHYSSDGATWTLLDVPPHWAETHAQAAIALSDGIYFTDGFQTPRFHVIREHTGALMSAWADQGTGAKHLSQSVDSKKPILDATAFGSNPGVAFTLSQLMALATPDRGITSGLFEAWVICKTMNLDVSSTQTPNSPSTLVGSLNVSAWNAFGLNGDGLDYRQYSGGYQNTQRGSGLNGDDVHVLGIQHQSGSLKFWADGVQLGTTQTANVGFDSTYTGWEALGAGYLEADPATAAVAAVVIRTTGSPWGATEMAKLQTYAAQITGSSPPVTPPPSIQFIGVNHNMYSSSTWTSNGGAGPLLGTNYIASDHRTIDFWKASGLNHMRMMFTWEWLQPTLNGAIPGDLTGQFLTYWNNFVSTVNYATSIGMTVLIEHFGSATNFWPGGGANTVPAWKGVGSGDGHSYTNQVGGGSVTNANFTNLWTQLATYFKTNPLVQFGMLNEPHDISTMQWFATAQAVITAIRATGATQYIHVPGNGYTTWNWNAGSGTGASASNAYGWANAGGVGVPLYDPLNKLVASFHMYMDDNGGNTADNPPTTYAIQGISGGTRPNAAKDRLQVMATWARAAGVKVHVTEIAFKATDTDAYACLAGLRDGILANADVCMGVNWWGGSDPGWWNNVSLTNWAITPTTTGAVYSGDTINMTMIKSVFGL